jgi:hypothetical protein
MKLTAIFTIAVMSLAGHAFAMSDMGSGQTPAAAFSGGNSGSNTGSGGYYPGTGYTMSQYNALQSARAAAARAVSRANVEVGNNGRNGNGSRSSNNNNRSSNKNHGGDPNTGPR